MMGYGRSCRYELHHPMSLADALAALFRAKPKKLDENVETLLGLGQRMEPGDEPVPNLPASEEPDAAATAHIEMK